MKAILTATAAMMISTAAVAADLKITHFTPGEGSLFPVSSNLIEGPNEVLLVDAQFEKDDAEQLVSMIKATGKPLTTVFISHKDPDFYFGLDTIRSAYPDVKIVATPETVKGIEKTIQLKYDFWGPILKDNAPAALIVPDVLEGNSLTVDGETIQVVGLEGHDPSHTFLWAPSEKTILGGVVLMKCTALALCLSPAVVIAQTTPSVSTHEHGTGSLALSFSEVEFSLSLAVPGTDIVGFERHAADDDDRAMVAVAISDLSKPLELFVVPAEAGCTTITANVTLAGESLGQETSEDTTQDTDAPTHTEFQADYQIQCQDLKALDIIQFAYFDRFPNAQKLSVQVELSGNLSEFDVTRATPLLDLSELH